MEQWTQALGSATATTSVARLYKGGYWALARTLVQETSLPVQAFVASAGLGLKDFAEFGPGYSATFNPEDSDVVAGGHESNGRLWWWRHLGGRARLRALGEAEQSRVLVALPTAYLAVLMPDLEVLQARLGTTRVLVFTADPSLAGTLGGSVVLLQGRMSKVLGGTAGQLTVRALDYVVRRAVAPEDLTPSRATLLLEEVRTRSPERLYPKRLRQTEGQVENWIRAALLSEQPPLSASAALKQFRAAGLACEQKHFGRLFRTLQAEVMP
jgi:hypothetical protein